MILVTGCFIVKEDRLAEALSLSLEHVRRSRLENGCIATPCIKTWRILSGLSFSKSGQIKRRWLHTLRYPHREPS